MLKNTKVTWITSLSIHGSGITISDEDNGYILVAVDAPKGEEHHVIWCTVTWLTVSK